MSERSLKSLFAVALLILVALYWHSHRPSPARSGPLVREVPEIGSPAAPPFPYKKHTITPIASIKFRARVLSTERYYADRGAKLSPMDLAIGWRGMSDSAYLKDLKISQFMRWYYFRYKEAPLSDDTIYQQSKNVHLIPAQRQTWKRLQSVRTGHVVRARGSLVNITGPNGFTWNSHPTLGGSGQGSCWLMWVEDVQIEN